MYITAVLWDIRISTWLEKNT